jgi:hypothetical protein
MRRQARNRAGVRAVGDNSLRGHAHTVALPGRVL